MEKLMSHPSDRGHRLHHRARLICKRVKQRPYWFSGITDPRRLERGQARLAKTSTPCSCVMCGNPRRYFGHDTLAEKKAGLREREWKGRDNMEE